MRLKNAALAGIAWATLMSGYLIRADEPAPAVGAFSPATQPATLPAPTTQPLLFSVRGHIRIAADWSLQKPDLTHVIAYLGSDPALDALPHHEEHVSVCQKNKTFVPNFTVIPRGTNVEFPNWDNFDHNVFSCSKAAPAFDLDRYPRGQSKRRTFEKVGVVQVFCNIHPQMRCIIFVTPNVLFSRADENGAFEITGVPAGKYELVIWQERCGEQRQPVEVSSDAAADVSITLSENRQQIIANDPPRKPADYGVERGLGVKRDRLNLPVVKESHPAPDPEK